MSRQVKPVHWSSPKYVLLLFLVCCWPAIWSSSGGAATISKQLSPNPEDLTTVRQRRTVVKRCDATQRSEYGGFGSQFQNIIQAAVYAEWHKKHFCVNPLTAVDHNYDNRDTFLREVNAIATLDLPRLPPQLYYCLFVQSCPTIDVTLEFIENKKRWFDEFIEEKEHADFAKQHLRKIGKDLKKSLATVPGKYAAVHVRRLNSLDYRPGFDQRILDSRTYCQAMRQVEAEHPGIRFVVHSQGTFEDFDIFSSEPRISLHLNKTLNSTFVEMVSADVLLVSHSSLSYSAGLLSQGEIWGPDSFWHSFPYYWKTFESKKMIELGEPCLLPISR